MNVFVQTKEQITNSAKEKRKTLSLAQVSQNLETQNQNSKEEERLITAILTNQNMS